MQEDLTVPPSATSSLTVTEITAPKNNCGWPRELIISSWSFTQDSLWLCVGFPGCVLLIPADLCMCGLKMYVCVVCTCFMCWVNEKSFANAKMFFLPSANYIVFCNAEQDASVLLFSLSHCHSGSLCIRTFVSGWYFTLHLFCRYFFLHCTPWIKKTLRRVHWVF